MESRKYSNHHSKRPIPNRVCNNDHDNGCYYIDNEMVDRQEHHGPSEKGRDGKKGISLVQRRSSNHQHLEQHPPEENLLYRDIYIQVVGCQVHKWLPNASHKNQSVAWHKVSCYTVRTYKKNSYEPPIKSKQ